MLGSGVNQDYQHAPLNTSAGSPCSFLASPGSSPEGEGHNDLRIGRDTKIKNAHLSGRPHLRDDRPQHRKSRFPAQEDLEALSGHRETRSVKAYSSHLAR